MKIISLKHHSENELIEKLRKVSLLHNAIVFPYKDAEITLTSFDPKEIHPAQFYFLESEIEKMEKLENELKKHGIDLMHVNGYVEYTLDTGEKFTLLPPIVEYYSNQQGEIVPILNDGMHRILYAQKKKQKIQVVAIKNAHPDYPIMGYPNLNKWGDVKSVVVVPEPKNKRIWRVPVEQGYMLYRNFNSAFGSVGKPRKTDEEN